MMNHAISCSKDRKTFMVSDIAFLPTNERILEGLKEESEEHSATNRQ